MSSASHATSFDHISVPPFPTQQTRQPQQAEKAPVIEPIIVGVRRGHCLILQNDSQVDPVSRRLPGTRTRARDSEPGRWYLAVSLRDVADVTRVNNHTAEGEARGQNCL
jgi:hypothetical protein